MSIRGGIDAVRSAHDAARAALVEHLSPEGFWTGRLSSSALSTATAVSALAALSPESHVDRICPGLAWIAAHQNPDGGWGDTADSPSNISTTLLATAAFGLAGEQAQYARVMQRSEAYLAATAGATAEERVEALRAAYGRDRTFAVPILANCALAGMVDWGRIPRLPFELAWLPARLYRWPRLHVVSYALPALIAIGQLLHSRNPTRQPWLRILRRLAEAPTLRKLMALQPDTGGFLEAVPLTSFVVMSLAAAGRPHHPVAERGLAFLQASQRADGSWPIDVNLSVWLTTAAVGALGLGGWEGVDAGRIRRWILARQWKETHPYTQSPPGGWGWTHLSGAVPDADDTSGALLALAALGGEGASEACRRGIAWLVNLQNADGGWPTFCRGWGKLPFDRSAPDLTAHALRALHVWRGSARPRRGERAVAAGLAYLRRTQRAAGSWAPLWFGSQSAPEGANLVYGTARVLAAYRDLGMSESAEAGRGVEYLLRSQDHGGGWGGAQGVAPSVEETALAVEALASWAGRPAVGAAVRRGCCRLVERIDGGALAPAPIGLYFARLWYSEELYPLLWSVAALARVLGPAGLRASGVPALVGAGAARIARERSAATGQPRRGEP